MTQTYRWLAAVGLLLALAAGAVRAEEEETPPQVRPVVEILPAPREAPSYLPMPLLPPLTWPFQVAGPCPCPMPLPIPATAPCTEACPGCPYCPVSACMAPNCAEPAMYVVSVRLCKAGGDGEQEVVAQPRISVAEGQTGTVEVTGAASPRAQFTTRMQVTVTRHGDDAFLALAVQDARCINGGGDARTHTESTETHAKIALRGAAQLLLDENPDGSPRTWAEVTVTEQGRQVFQAACTRACPTAQSGMEEDQDDSVPGVFAQVVQTIYEAAADIASDLFDDAPAMPCYTLPSGEYLQHPPQYFPAEPAMPMARELSAPAACPVGQCDTPAAGCGSGCRQCEYTEAVKDAGAHWSIDASGDRKCVEMTNGKEHFKASAAHLMMHDDAIELQGDVRAESCDDSCNDCTKIKADKMHLEWKDGGLKIEVEGSGAAAISPSFYYLSR